MYSINYVFHEKLFKKIYPTRIEYIYLYKSRERGFEELYSNKNTENNKKNTDFLSSEVERVSISRIKSKVKDYAECNNFQYFYTQTIKNDRFNLDNFKSIIQKKFKAYIIKKSNT